MGIEEKKSRNVKNVPGKQLIHRSLTGQDKNSSSFLAYQITTLSSSGRNMAPSVMSNAS